MIMQLSRGLEEKALENSQQPLPAQDGPVSEAQAHCF